jgi:hypothetical protein
MLVTSMASSFDALAERDQKCFQDCTNMGYQWAFCDSKCSYDGSNTQSGFGGGLSGLAKQFNEGGIAAGWIKGEQEGTRQALIQQQTEALKLQNEILRRQLDGNGNLNHPTQPAATPQNGRASGAEFRDADALLNLGLRYAKGDGVPQDSARAVELFRKAAALGNASAINNLGWMYANGDGVRQNYSQALDMFRVAAEKGSPTAHAHLGNAYEMGLGVPKNYEEALAWYRKAAILGNEWSKQKIASIEKTLTQQTQTPLTSASIEMTARSQAINDGCEIASINNVQPPKGFNSAYEIRCSDSSTRKYICDSDRSYCSAISVVRHLNHKTN